MADWSHEKRMLRELDAKNDQARRAEERRAEQDRRDAEDYRINNTAYKSTLVRLVTEGVEEVGGSDRIADRGRYELRNYKMFFKWVDKPSQMFMVVFINTPDDQRVVGVLDGTFLLRVEKGSPVVYLKGHHGGPLSLENAAHEIVQALIRAVRGEGDRLDQDDPLLPERFAE